MRCVDLDFKFKWSGALTGALTVAMSAFSIAMDHESWKKAAEQIAIARHNTEDYYAALQVVNKHIIISNWLLPQIRLSRVRKTHVHIV